MNLAASVKFILDLRARAILILVPNFTFAISCSRLFSYLSQLENKTITKMAARQA